MAIYYGILNTSSGGGGSTGIVSKGTFTDPTAAKAGGLVVGDWFTIAAGSLYAVEGQLIQIIS